ncbi:uncharacterized protein LOC103032132 [Astyanax mexicanus]|uniref:uncharacterized protein LOC103032132 n=1 Tax=Astyanax mexicanus TaxID=7994 RepID=UPI0020CB36AA|nr:uncharacterized protein LOC103032132 [Astyanax mexicanus]
MEEESEKIKIQRDNAERPDSPGSSCVSLKSEQSTGEPPNFKDGSVHPDSENAERPDSPGFSCVSFKSEQSMGETPNFKDGSVPQDSENAEKPNSPGSSCVSFKSEQSMGESPNFKDGSVPHDSENAEKPNSPGSSCVSFKSEQSMGESPNFKDGSVPQDRQNSVSVSSGETQTEERKTAGTGGKLQKKIKDHLKHILHELEKRIHGFIKQELEIYRTHLMKSNIKNNDVEKDTWNLKQGVLNMTQYFLKKMNHEDLAEALQKELIGIQEHALKCKLSEKCRHVCEGIAQQGESTILNKIYTDMYITEGAAGQVNKDHEVRLIQKNNVKADAGQLQQDVQIECKNMFELLPEQERPIRTVLTQGVAGIGKSICVQKFILDWAEEKEYKDIQFIFPLPFRELNLKKGRQSLMDIICFFFPETEGLRLTDQHNIMFILDGLDECQLPLAFQKNNNMNNVSEAAPLDVVLTNLIKGNLLPSAQIWITTRPAAASKIPAECVDRMTELRGFNDQQKEQYFRKRITDQVMANKLIDHIRESRSLHIMCHIPVFCWISATVLQKILEETESEETPKTLTEMYTCFLIFQAVQGNMKYTRKNAFDIPWDKEAILALGKLSFQHLEESNLIFYIEDLEECGIDPSKILICSGLCTQETVRFLGTVFSFVHLSIQEFLAAVFAYLSLKNDNRNVFEPQSTSQESKTTELIDFLKTAVDKALESDHGHLDLFLRFLLGLSLESNEKLIRGLLTVGLLTGSSSDCRKEIVEYIKIKFKENPSPERSINLFYCLNELNDDSLVKEIQSYMSSGRLSEAKLSPAQWSALVFVLLTSKEKLDEFDLKKFIRSEECLNRLLPVVKEATTALLNECNLTERSCSALLEVLKSESSTLTLLDMSKNSIQDSGMELLCEGLKSSKCKVETLILSECNLTERSCSALFKVLSSESSRLTLLDLSNNAIQDSGVELLSEGLKSPQCKLEKLRLSQCNLTERSCSAVLKVLSSESSTLTLLDLSNNPIQDSGVEMLCEGLNSLNCKLETLRIINDDLTDKSCSDLARVLTSSTLRELDLSNNNLQDSGVNKLTSALKNPSCKLKTLSLSFCSVKEKGYADLASGLRKNASSCLIELDLRGNDPGDTGVKNLSDPNCKLNTLRLLKSEAAEEAYNCLKNILNEDPLTQRTLDLSKTAPKDINVKNLSALLEDPHCRVEKLRMYEASSVTFDNCADVISALNISPSHLRELDLNGNILGQLGLQKLCELLENPHCKLEILRLKNSITKEGCGALMSALCSNPSHLIELDLSGNKFGNPGVEHISCLLKDSDGKVKRLNLSNCDITEGGYDALASALKSNPSSRLMELDLRGNDPGDTGVRLLTELIEDQNCNLKTLRLLNSDSGEKACNTLTKALKKDSFLQRELDLSRKIQKSSPWRDEKGQTGYQHQNIPKDLSNVLSDLENKMTVFMKHELEMYKKCLKKENTPYYRKVKQIRWNLKQTVLNMTLDFLKLTNNEDVAAALQNELIGIIQRPLKEGMKNKYHHVCEGITKQAESTSMNKIYTDLYITEGGSGHVNHEHEVRRIEKNQMQQEVQIECRNMFELLPGQDRPIRTVLTQGVAGVGKSICVQKFILDWAEGEEHQDIQFIFPLPFRELNLKKGRHSLMDIISFFFPETQGLILTDQYKVMFIFDGLDDCKLPLSFYKNESLENVCEAASLDVVLTNLIKGNLLPSAQIWITTRPVAASMIPAECVDRVSEVRGFNDQQKEEYFRKRISDQDLANKIIDHIRESRSLFIMCHIPVFCWISATVLQEILEETESEETPKTLTNMYTCFLIFQAVQGNVKYNGKDDFDIPWDKEAILGLGKLSFQHLEENNLIFYIEDLEECGVDTSKISVYSGLCTQETVRFLGTVFSFVHLSIQEFIAALFAYLSLRNDNRNVFEPQSTSQESKTTELIDFLKTAVDKALESDHGHLDLFLRFLLGLSLESNEKLIRGLLTQTGSSSDCQKEIVEYIKSKFKENPSPERSINLFYCLNELNDDSLVKEIQSYMSSGRLSEVELSPAQWSALVFVLLTSKEKLDVFDLKKFIRSDECLNRLLPVVQEATSALLSDCNLTEKSCSVLLKVLNSESSTLTLLDLSYNPIKDFGVELLSEGLKSSNCKLETLNLSSCSITGNGYISLASALNPSSPLKELDLRGNDPGDTGVKIMTDFLQDTTYKLKLRLLNSSDAEEICKSKDLGENLLLLRELNLRGKIQGDSGMKQLSALLKDLHCRIKKLKLNNNNIAEDGCAALSSALYSNPSHLIDLDLSENKLGNSGVKQLCSFLNKTDCKLQQLKLSFCSITEEGYAALASAIKSNPSSLLNEMDLRGNDPGETGVELLTNLQNDAASKLKKIRLLKSSAAEEAFASLTEVLGTNPLLLRELDLSEKIRGDSAVKQLSDLLEDSHCRPKKLKLKNNNISEEGCTALSAALCSNPSHLIDLNLSENKLLTAGVKQFSAVLKNPQCQLQKLKLSCCSITEEGYVALASALKSNPFSLLTELDLRGNDPGETGVQLLTDLQNDPRSNLKRIFFFD